MPWSRFCLIVLMSMSLPASALSETSKSCLGLGNDQEMCMPLNQTDTDKYDNLNILDKPLQECGFDPITGFYRSGYCETSASDRGVHVVCAVLNDAFLHYSRTQGNDLITPRPEYGFPGLQDGDRWCLCAMRWLEAYEADLAPPIDVNATHQRALEIIPAEILYNHGFKK